MTGEMIYGRPPTKLERSHAKTVFLGLCYGMGGAKLCKQIGLPTRWVVRNLGLTWEERMQVFEYGTPEAEALIKQGQQPYEAAGEEGQRSNRSMRPTPAQKFLHRLCSEAMKSTWPSLES